MREYERATFAISLDSELVANQLEAKLGFPDRMSVAKLGFAVAFSADNPLEDIEKWASLSGGSTYNFGSYDRDRLLLNLINSTFTDSYLSPDTLVAGLTNKGLAMLKPRLNQITSFEDLFSFC